MKNTFSILNPSEIATISTDKVASVYSGIDGRCCCGCAGNHSYNSKYANIGLQLRGYPIKPEEVSDRNVTRILNVLKKSSLDQINIQDSYISTIIGKRIYVVYFI